MNKCLRANQAELQVRLRDEECRSGEAAAQQEVRVAELQEQVRDLMFYLETQQQISQMPEDTRQEIQEGQINIAAAPSPPGSTPGTSATKLGTRKGRGKRGK